MPPAAHVEFQAVDADLIAPRFSVLVAVGTCWKCKEPTPMAGVWVPSYTEVDPEDSEHEPCPEAAVLHYIEGLTHEVLAQVQAVAPGLRYAHTEGADRTYLANHCQRCDTVQGDWFVFGVDGPFFPQTQAEIDQIQVHPGQGMIHAMASAAMSSWMDEIER